MEGKAARFRFRALVLGGEGEEVGLPAYRV